LNNVLGTKGYEDVVEAFAEASFKLDFEEINADFLRFLPKVSARVLDVGSGIGQNSAALANRGYSVVSVEPLNDFLKIAKSLYNNLNITWIKDSLPDLEKVTVCDGLFDFILMDGVWHHLDIIERRKCIQRLSGIVSTGGICAISLRNGPAGAGKHIFPTSNDELIDYAKEFGFQVISCLENQPSKMQNKPNVIWSRVALKKL